LIQSKLKKFTKKVKINLKIFMALHYLELIYLQIQHSAKIRYIALQHIPMRREKKEQVKLHQKPKHQVEVLKIAEVTLEGASNIISIFAYE